MPASTDGALAATTITTTRARGDWWRAAGAAGRQAGAGTRLRMTETGFRERGWDEATVAAHAADHVTGWDHYLPRLLAYAAEVGAHA